MYRCFDFNNTLSLIRRTVSERSESQNAISVVLILNCSVTTLLSKGPVFFYKTLYNVKLLLNNEVPVGPAWSPPTDHRLVQRTICRPEGGGSGTRSNHLMVHREILATKGMKDFGF